MEEPAPEIAVQMVRGLTPAMSEHHKVEILNEAVAAAVHLSSRYIAGRQLPDKAISVLDTACARVALSRAGKPGPIEDVSVLIDNIDREISALQREEGHAERIAELEAQRAELRADLEQLHAAWDEQQKLVAEIDELKQRQAEAKPVKGKSRARCRPSARRCANCRSCSRWPSNAWMRA